MTLDLKRLTVPLSSVLALIAALWLGLQWADARYALAAEVREQAQKLEAKIEDLREKELLDRKFELEFIPEEKRTDLQRAQLERIKAELDSIHRKMNYP